MSEGLSRQQSAILDAVPAPDDGTPEGVSGITIRAIAERIGRLSAARLSGVTELRAIQLALGYRDGQRYLSIRDRFAIYRALRSLERRGLVEKSGPARSPAGRWRRRKPPV